MSMNECLPIEDLMEDYSKFSPTNKDKKTSDYTALKIEEDLIEKKTNIIDIGEKSKEEESIENATETEQQLLIDKNNNTNKAKKYSPFVSKIRYFLIFLSILAIVATVVCVLRIISKSLGPCRYHEMLSLKHNIVPYIYAPEDLNQTMNEYYIFNGNDDEYYTHTQNSFEVLLFGDSLISRPAANFDLTGKINSYIPQFAVNITTAAGSGVKISDMRRNIDDIIGIIYFI